MRVRQRCAHDQEHPALAVPGAIPVLPAIIVTQTMVELLTRH
ncbi:protein of unknown function [Thiomonas sp. Sup16B3]|nr:hypothetical protein THICB3320504 [Thiomonas sp. CB3]VDY09815.1 protein of unknown function [Thiomonas sp. Sup16B3]VDY15662.1 protein of unknown function [Thiomonas sp. CB2]